MGKYVHKFANQAAYNQARDNNYIEPWVSYTEGKGLDYNKNYTKIPFTIAALGSGNITWALGDKTVQYSKNGGSWETMDSSTTISVVEGDKVQFKGTNTNYNGNTISTTMRFNVEGNIMSLTWGDNFKTANTVNEQNYRNLFHNNQNIISAELLKLPAENLAPYCYCNLFYGCSNLTAVQDQLPAMIMKNSCYSNMYYGTAITTAPELPALTLDTSCYSFMFCRCPNLTVAPKLPARTLVSNCYYFMFSRCTSLKYIKAMFTTAPSSSYMSGWVGYLPSTGTFVKNAEAEWTNVFSDSAIPSGWTVQTANS